MKHFSCWLTLLAGLLTGCHRKDPAPQNPADLLPPATQTGANTFGCLVNGQAWTPRGNNGYSNYSVYYDPSYHDGTLNVAAYRYAEGQSQNTLVSVGSDSLQPGVGIYKLRPLGRHRAGFENNIIGCFYDSNEVGTYCRGSLTITRLDKAVGIISGTFAFVLYKPGCDSVRVTQGRFDKQL